MRLASSPAPESNRPREAIFAVRSLTKTYGEGDAAVHALSGVDLVQMTDDMAMKIMGDPEVQAAVAARGPLKVVVNQVPL